MKVVRFLHTASKGWIDLPDCEQLDSESTMVMAFCSSMYFENHVALKELKSFFPKSSVVGCSTSGEIHGNELHDLSIAVAVIQFESTSVKAVKRDIIDPSQSEIIGSELANELISDDLKGIVILSDGIQVNGSTLAAGFNKVIDSSKVSIGGGLAGDGNKFKRTFTVFDGEILNSSIVAIGFYGDHVGFSNSSVGGWDKFGPERVITKSTGNIVYEIDGKPALDLYKTYLGEKASELPASGLLFPLEIRSSADSEKRLVRTLLAVSEEENSLIFAGDVPEGSIGQLMRANFDRVIGAAVDAAEEICDTIDVQEPSFALAVSCVGRRLVLGDRVEEEIESLNQVFGESCQISGFYSYGELASVTKDSPCELHNQTMTVLHISEKKAA